jgi:sporulation protein YlmC with PRC-barrel domain
LSAEFVETTSTYNGREPTAVQLVNSSPKFRKVKHLNIPEGEVAIGHSTRVRASDGRAGRIDRLMVDPMTGSLTHLVVREGPAWSSKAVPVPIAEVKRIGEKAVYLRTNRASIEALPSVRP